MTSRVIITFTKISTGETKRLYIREGVAVNVDVEKEATENSGEYEITRVRQAGYVPRTFDENYVGMVSAVKEPEVEEEEEEVIVVDPTDVEEEVAV